MELFQLFELFELSELVYLRKVLFASLTSFASVEPWKIGRSKAMLPSCRSTCQTQKGKATFQAKPDPGSDANGQISF